MKKRNGFTILELMVTMAVFAVVAAAAVALFQFQSKSAAGSNKRKVASEAVTLALMTIQRDIERAGMGLLLQQPLSVLVVDGRNKTIDPADKRPDELYLSFSDHVSMDLGRDRTYSFFDLGSSPGLDKLWFSVGGRSYIDLKDVGAWIGTDGTQPPVGSVIRQLGTARPDVVALRDYSASQTGAQKNKGQCTVRLTLPGTYSGNAAPAVSYTLITNAQDQAVFAGGRTPQLGTLLRNGIPQTSGGVPLVGAWSDEPVPSVKVTNFQVRCGFRTAACNFADYYTDHTRTACWSPENGHSLGEAGWEIGNLRVIEVTISYIVQDKAAGAKYPSQITTEGFQLASDSTPGPWSLGGSQTITVAPRNLVLGQYLGPPK